MKTKIINKMESNLKVAKRRRLKRYFAKNPFNKLEELLVISTDSLTFKDKLDRKNNGSVKYQRLHLSQLFVTLIFITLI